MNALLTFLRGLTARCIIVTAFCIVAVLDAAALCICAIWRITPDPGVLTNMKELTIASVSALGAILVPRGEQASPKSDAQNQQPDKSQ